MYIKITAIENIKSESEFTNILTKLRAETEKLHNEKTSINEKLLLAKNKFSI